MSERRQTIALVGVGAAACAACCAGPILGVLAAIGLGTAIGAVFFGVAAIAIGGLVAAAFVAHRRGPLRRVRLRLSAGTRVAAERRR